ncbi:MAG: VWA domain-containing protein [Thermoanaerobaculia bacterium]|nr:VWA domain-containing protein [Thermoanaerobaculia bacterium]
MSDQTLHTETSQTDSPTEDAAAGAASDDAPTGAVAEDAPAGAVADDERLQRWRLILGGGEADGVGCPLSTEALQMDRALAALYAPDEKGGLRAAARRRGGSGGSAPRVARWLGDIREYFPASVVQVMQRDALERLDLHEMLLEPEMLEAVQPGVHLVADLIGLSRVIPEATKASARAVVRKVVDDLMKRLEEPMRSAVSGALDRSVRNRRPRLAEIDWGRTIRANLRHYQEEYRTIVPEQLIGHGRKSRRTQKHIILAIDQSGSMASSVVYSSIFGAVMASLPAVQTHLVVFDTEVIDLTEKLDDPVDVLFGTQLGGGTFINQAVGYCQSLVREPRDTILVLISDLYEGGVERELLRRTADLIESGVQFITLLALSDEGAPWYDQQLAAKMSALGAPAFACTPDLFPELMAAAIKRENIAQWAAERDVVTSRGRGD